VSERNSGLTADVLFVMIQGIALQAQHGGTKDQLMKVVDANNRRRRKTQRRSQA
jgi:hypothetical protein